VGDVPADQQSPAGPGWQSPAGPGSLAAALRQAGLAVRQLASDWRSARPWITTGGLLVSAVLGGLFSIITTLALLLVGLTAWIIGLGLMVRAGALWLSAWQASVDRRRIQWFDGIVIQPLALPRVAPGAGLRARQEAWARSPWLWRLPAYQLARLLLVCVLGFGAVTWWWGCIICFVLAAQPPRPVHFLAWVYGSASLGPVSLTVLVLAGVAGLLAWPAVVRTIPAADVWLGRWLLGPSRASALSTEVARLSRARSQAVAAAEAERRRIERDLHDGLQPQLVSLALDLGLAKVRLRTDPAAAQSLIDRAHEEAKRAAEDLRNLVRGIHPSVLDERGLDAALSALVASCPVPVAVTVSLAARPGQAPEAAAYFLVAEAITNITKHASARHGAVTITSAAGALLVTVEDDGAGGARLEPGGGLAGLAGRIASLDGTFRLTSPAGGPTRIEAVIPCAP
jgi:signal transduction histidine kinase